MSVCVHVVCVAVALFVTPAIIISKHMSGTVMAVLVTMEVACIVFVCKAYVCTPLHMCVLCTFVRTYCRVWIYGT